MISNEKWQTINSIIYKIYSSRDNVELRKGFLEDFNKLIPHNFAFFDLWKKDKGQYIFYDPISLNLNDEQLEDYYLHFEKMDYVAKIGGDINESVVLRNTDVLTNYTRSQSALYTEFFSHINAQYICGAFIRYRTEPFGSICFGRDETHGDFTDDEIELMNIVIQHLGLQFHLLDLNHISVSHSVTDSILSGREKEITALLLDGCTSEEIARKLYISSGTARKHISNIYKKLNVSNRTQLIIRMIENKKNRK